MNSIFSKLDKMELEHYSIQPMVYFPFSQAVWDPSVSSKKKLVIFVLGATLAAFFVECLCPVCQKYFSYFDFHFGVLKIDIAVAFCDNYTL